MQYMSLRQYLKKYKIGYNTALQMMYSGELKYTKTPGGQYKICVYDETTIPFEKYEKLLKENEKLKTMIKNIQSILKEDFYE